MLRGEIKCYRDNKRKTCPRDCHGREGIKFKTVIKTSLTERLAFEGKRNERQERKTLGMATLAERGRSKC